ncbi:hypothetical protein EYF80_004229 [Liparis tanakae]|uniref:Uncharacterized protein n=1 Tax=Liparis tanakae TaxID=230148 RepID=A0A4Z2J5X6_9TELE|nr:hypothetical protein EYF80_004229 [Liparis tanakae]
MDLEVIWQRAPRAVYRDKEHALRCQRQKTSSHLAHICRCSTQNGNANTFFFIAVRPRTHSCDPGSGDLTGTPQGELPF